MPALNSVPIVSARERKNQEEGSWSKSQDLTPMPATPTPMTMGQTKNDGLLDGSRLKDEIGDAIHALPSGAGHALSLVLPLCGPSWPSSPRSCAVSFEAIGPSACEAAVAQH